jgi:adenine phosphoribosyltransferase
VAQGGKAVRVLPAASAASGCASHQSEVAHNRKRHGPAACPRRLGDLLLGGEIGWLCDRSEDHSDPLCTDFSCAGIIIDMSIVEQARAAFLRTFRWTGGHADLAAVFADAGVLALLGPALAEPFGSSGVTVVVAPEARGFVLGALCAEHLGVGLVLARKPGSVHPGEKVEVVSAPDWRGRAVTFRLARVLTSVDMALVVDDWIETGSQARAIKEGVEASGAQFAGTSVIVDDTTADARVDLNLASLVRSAELPAAI